MCDIRCNIQETVSSFMTQGMQMNKTRHHILSWMRAAWTVRDLVMRTSSAARTPLFLSWYSIPAIENLPGWSRPQLRNEGMLFSNIPRPLSWYATSDEDTYQGWPHHQLENHGLFHDVRYQTEEICPGGLHLCRPSVAHRWLNSADELWSYQL